MKSLKHNWPFWMTPMILALLAFATGAHAATTNGAAPATGTNTAVVSTNNAACTNSGPVELPVPLSVFNITLQPTKDPFFPLSTRQPVTTTNNAAPAFSITEFTLKGLSGTARNRLALINNRTLADGEEAEVTTPSGKIKIHCLEIKDNSVVIRAGLQHETMEIFLRKAAQ